MCNKKKKLYKAYKITLIPKMYENIKMARVYILLFFEMHNQVVYVELQTWSEKYYGSCSFLNMQMLKRNSISVLLIFKYKLHATRSS